MEIVRNTNFDFLGKTRLWVSISLALVAASIGYVAKNGVRTGVEFSGGTQVIAKFQSRPALDRVRSAVEQVAPGATIQTFDDPSKNQVLIRVATAVEGELDKQAQRVLEQLTSSYGENPVVESSTEIVGPVVGAELTSKAIRLTVLGLLFQLIYIGFRFNGFVWGSAATIAVLHDVVVTLGLLAISGYDITLNVIAALLTLVGYSVNDTIVIFDRVRENLRQRRKEPLTKIINDSLNQTLSRTLISNGTTFLTVLGLFLFGGEVLRGFAFTMVVGIIVGSYSTIYIASPIVIFWQGLLQRKPSATAKVAL
jgi:preprotein translocase subunit SecF